MSMTSARDPGGGLLLALAVILLNDRHRIEYLMYEVYVSFVERVATLPLTVASQSLSPTSIAHNAHRPIGSEYHFRADLVGMMLKINQGKLEADDVQIYSDVRIPKGKTLLVHGILPGSESKSEGKSEVSGEIAILIRPEIVRPTATSKFFLIGFAPIRARRPPSLRPVTVGCLQVAVLHSIFVLLRSAMSLAAGVVGEGIARLVGRLKPL